MIVIDILIKTCLNPINFENIKFMFFFAAFLEELTRFSLEVVVCYWRFVMQIYLMNFLTIELQASR
jgi:hypothetical protein